MLILKAKEALTLQTLFLLFNSKGSSSKCCSSVGLCDTSLCSGWVSANGHLFHDVLSDTSVNPDHKSFGKKFLDIFLFRSHQRPRSLHHPHVIGVAPPTSPSDEEHHQTPMGFNSFGASLATPKKELLRPSASPSCLGHPMPSTVPASASISQFYNHVFLSI